MTPDFWWGAATGALCVGIAFTLVFFAWVVREDPR